MWIIFVKVTNKFVFGGIKLESSCLSPILLLLFLILFIFFLYSI